MFIKLTCAIVFMVVLGLAPRAFAQIVNVQSQIKDIPDGFSGAIEGEGEWKTGSTKLIEGGAALRLAYRHEDDLLFGIVKGKYGKLYNTDPDTLIASRTFGHIRYRHTLSCWLIGEAFVQNETDRFRRLATRTLLGGGGRFILVENEKYDAYFGAAYMFEYEHLRDDKELDANQTQYNHRGSFYFVGNLNLSKTAQASGSTYVQPKLTAPSDYRVLVEASIKSALAKNFALKTGFTLVYDTAPPASLPRFDTGLETSVEYTF